jgi:hypothetical protein
MRIPIARAGPEVGRAGSCAGGACVPALFYAHGFLAMPAAGPGGACQEGVFVRYFQNVKSEEPCAAGGPAPSLPHHHHHPPYRSLHRSGTP